MSYILSQFFLDCYSEETGVYFRNISIGFGSLFMAMKTTHGQKGHQDIHMNSFRAVLLCLPRRPWGYYL